MNKAHCFSADTDIRTMIYSVFKGGAMNTAQAVKLDILTNGRLSNLDDWTPDIANQLATQDGISLNNAHWDLITLLRGYYAAFKISPTRKLLKREIKKNLGPELANDDYLVSLFPNDIQIQGTKIAGIPVSIVDAEIEHNIQTKKLSKTSPERVSTSETEFLGKKIQLYSTGNLVDQNEWSPELADHLAKLENIELTDAHWLVITFLRTFYFQYAVTPMVNLLIKHLAEEFDTTISDEKRLYELFPKGPSRQGSQIAGLPAPQGCIDMDR